MHDDWLMVPPQRLPTDPFPERTQQANQRAADQRAADRVMYVGTAMGSRYLSLLRLPGTSYLAYHEAFPSCVPVEHQTLAQSSITYRSIQRFQPGHSK